MKLKAEEDLRQLLRSKIQESPNLDYKQSITENKEIAKDISAFANTKGGVIIYGIKEEKLIPRELTPLVMSNIPERIENVLQTAIHPKLDCKISPILCAESDTKGYIVVEIPESPLKPHMVNYNHRYYRRHDFSSVPMEEYEIERCYEERRKSVNIMNEFLKQEENMIKEDLKTIEQGQILFSYIVIPLTYRENTVKIFAPDFDEFIRALCRKHDLGDWYSVSVIGGETKLFGYPESPDKLVISDAGKIKYSAHDCNSEQKKALSYLPILSELGNFLEVIYQIMEHENYFGHLHFRLRLDKIKNWVMHNFYNDLKNMGIDRFFEDNDLKERRAFGIIAGGIQFQNDFITVDKEFPSSEIKEQKEKIILEIIKELHRKWGYNIPD